METSLSVSSRYTAQQTEAVEYMRNIQNAAPADVPIVLDIKPCLPETRRAVKELYLSHKLLNRTTIDDILSQKYVGWPQRLNFANAKTIVATKGNETLGAASVKLHMPAGDNPPYLEIIVMAVRQSSGGQGVGRLLGSFLMQKASEVGCHMLLLSSCSTATEFWTSVGCVKLDKGLHTIYQEYYENDCVLTPDTVAMIRDIRIQRPWVSVSLAMSKMFTIVMEHGVDLHAYMGRRTSRSMGESNWLNVPTGPTRMWRTADRAGAQEIADCQLAMPKLTVEDLKKVKPTSKRDAALANGRKRPSVYSKAIPAAKARCVSPQPNSKSNRKYTVEPAKAAKANARKEPVDDALTSDVSDLDEQESAKTILTVASSPEVPRPIQLVARRKRTPALVEEPASTPDPTHALAPELAAELEIVSTPSSSSPMVCEQSATSQPTAQRFEIPTSDPFTQTSPIQHTPTTSPLKIVVPSPQRTPQQTSTRAGLTSPGVMLTLTTPIRAPRPAPIRTKVGGTDLGTPGVRLPVTPEQYERARSSGSNFLTALCRAIRTPVAPPLYWPSPAGQKR